MAHQGFELITWKSDDESVAAHAYFKENDRVSNVIQVPMRHEVREYLWSTKSYVAELYEINDSPRAVALQGIAWRQDGSVRWRLCREDLENQTGHKVNSVHKVIGYACSDNDGLLLINPKDRQGSIWKVNCETGMMNQIKFASPAEPIPMYSIASAEGRLLGLTKPRKPGQGTEWQIIHMRDGQVMQYFETKPESGPYDQSLLEDGIIVISNDNRSAYLQHFDRSDIVTLLGLKELLPN